ncbi:MAG: glycosyltransferase family 2 protein [Trichodesmium sp.]
MTLFRIAVLITCHNRRPTTLACLEALFQQELPSAYNFQVYLVDDGSNDGTGDAVRAAYPTVKILTGDGSLFWNGGTRKAFGEALKSDYDYYLWLNDDTLLYRQTLDNLLSLHKSITEKGYALSILVGATCDPETGTLTYGGQLRSNWWHPLKFHVIEPTKEPLLCHTMNGNCVLIPRNVAEVVGNLDTIFVHSSGDIDYGLRLRKHGGYVWLAPGYMGTCKTNSSSGTWQDSNISIRQRWQKVIGVKGLPIQEWKVFARRHGGYLWFLYWWLPYLRLILTSVFSGFSLKKSS